MAATLQRKKDKRISAPPDFGEPWFRPELPHQLKRLGTSEDLNKITYKFDTILQVRDDCESYVKPLPIVKIWRRKLRSVIVYRIDQIQTVGDQDDSWILPYDIVKFQRRKVREEINEEELYHD